MKRLFSIALKPIPSLLLCLHVSAAASDLASPAQSNAPAVAIVRDAVGPLLTFVGTLQRGPSVTGPWEDLTAASSPYRPDFTGDARFYRARTPDGIFAAETVVSLSIAAPLQQYFELAHAGQPDGIFPPIREKPYFDGSVVVAGQHIPASLRVRGNSSLQECPFPKLKFKVSRENRVGTPFSEAREVKVGTHCAEGGRGNIGRLREQAATFREALAYEAMRTLGFVTPRVRRAVIDYEDTTATNLTMDAGWQLQRQALVLEDIEVLAERLGGRALSDEEVSALTNANFEAQLVTDLRFLHALLGNWDYTLPLDGRGLWNTDVMERADQRLVPVAGDFDLASWVTGVIRLSVPFDYHPELADADRQARYDLEQIQQQLGPATFNVARDRFVGQRPALESLVASAAVDEPGRTNAQRHVTAFFDAVTALTRGKP